MTARAGVLVVGLVPLLVVLLASGAGAQGVGLETAGAGTAAGLWFSRLLNHTALAATVGLLLVPAWLLPRTGSGRAGRRAARLAAVAAAVWSVSAGGVLLFGLSNAAAQPLPQVLDADALSRFLGTRFGGAVAVQAAVAAAVALVAASARTSGAARAALAGALLGAVAPAWWGHAGTAAVVPLAVLADWLHIASASVWAGGLLGVTVLVLGRTGHPQPHGPTARFSGLAGWAILVVAATGVVNTVLHTGAPQQLLTTQWGRLALVKALLLIGLAGFGYAHRRRTIPRLEVADDRRARRLFTRVALSELVVMLAAFGLATTMASGVPAEAEAAGRIQTVVTALGDGYAEVTLDPAATGANEVHLYVFEADGRTLRPVDDAALELRLGDQVVAPSLLRSGTGHLLGVAQLPVAGEWQVVLDLVLEGDEERATASLTVR